jgi:hypothetical protein
MLKNSQRNDWLGIVAPTTLKAAKEMNYLDLWHELGSRTAKEMTDLDLWHELFGSLDKKLSFLPSRVLGTWG